MAKPSYVVTGSVTIMVAYVSEQVKVVTNCKWRLTLEVLLHESKIVMWPDQNTHGCVIDPKWKPFLS